MTTRDPATPSDPRMPSDLPVTTPESDEDTWQRGESIVFGNEFAEIRVTRVDGRNGSRLLIESTRTGERIALCPLEVEALTWQDSCTFSAMIGRPHAALYEEDE
jgi:hypothetical protein